MIDTDVLGNQAIQKGRYLVEHSCSGGGGNILRALEHQE